MILPVILLDCDGPLARFSEAWLAAHFIECGVLRDVREIDRWDMASCAWFAADAAKAGLEPSALKKRIAAHVIRPGFCEEIEVQAGAKEAVAKLAELAEVFVVTSPWDSSPTWMHERMHWVHRHFGIPRGHVIQAGRKHLIRGDVFVDDKASHVLEWSAAWPDGTAILFDMAHNRADDVGDVVRAGWDHIVQVAMAMKVAA